MDYSTWISACIQLICTILYFKSTDAQNAQLTAIPAEVCTGDSITFTCNYIGTKNETAIIWFNGSYSNALTLTPGLNVPDCNIFSIVNHRYDSARIIYTCDLEKNKYTLRIDPVEAVDENVTWSCTFSDPVPNSNKAEFTIHLKVSLIGGSGDDDKSNTKVIVAVGVILLIFTVVVVTVVIYKRKNRCHFWNNDTNLCKTSREERTTNQEEISLTHQP